MAHPANPVNARGAEAPFIFMGFVGTTEQLAEKVPSKSLFLRK
jgi:hypothetical protein